jgi:hypothetical protein
MTHSHLKKIKEREIFMAYGPIAEPIYFVALQEKTTKVISFISNKDESVLKTQLSTYLNHNILAVVVGKQLKITTRMETVIEEL